MPDNNSKPHINVDYFEDLTGDISSYEPAQVDEIGQRIRKIRESKGIGIEELSSLTGFGTDLLAAIESNQVQPQLGTIIKLSKALDSAVGRIIAGEGTRTYAITRRGEHKTVARSTSGQGSKSLYTYMSLAPDVKGRHMEALLVKLEEAEDDQPSVHDGEEFIYVLQGVVVFTIGKETYELEPGDSAYYLSTTAHLLKAKSGSATILAVLYQG